MTSFSVRLTAICTLMLLALSSQEALADVAGYLSRADRVEDDTLIRGLLSVLGFVLKWGLLGFFAWVALSDLSDALRGIYRRLKKIPDPKADPNETLSSEVLGILISLLILSVVIAFVLASWIF